MLHIESNISISVSLWQAEKYRFSELSPLLGFLEYLSEDVQKYVCMLLLEDKRWSDADAALTAASSLDTFGSEARHQIVADLGAGGVDGEERAPAAGGGQDVGELLLQASQALVQDVARGPHHAQQLVPADHLEHLLQEQHLPRIAHPRVENSVRQVGRQVSLVEVAAHEHLLGEGDHVRRAGKVEVLVAPELAGGAAAGLHLVDE